MRFALHPIDFLTAIKSFYNQYVSKEARLVYSLLLLMIAIGCTYMVINVWFTRYPGFDYVPLRWIILAPFVLAVTLLAMTAHKSAPRLAQFTQCYGTFFFVALSCAIMTTGVQYTPFQPIDLVLAKLDQAMGVNTPALMSWTAHHPYIHKILALAYSFLYVEIVAVPLLLPFFKRNNNVNYFFITMLLAFIIGTTSYYFFPTAAPAAVFHSPYFMSGEYATYLKFYQIHHYQHVASGAGGLIAFPSFHVAWAIILTCVTFSKKWFFIPLALVNIILIAATVLLGFHYLIDVVGGVFLATLAMLLAQRVRNKYLLKQLVTQ